MSSPSLDFAEFVQAAQPTGTSFGDPLDEITLFLERAKRHIERVRIEVETFEKDGGGYFFSDECNPSRMEIAAWRHVVARVNALLIAPAHVEVPNVDEFVESAFGPMRSRGRRLSAGELIERWDAARMRAHFEAVIGDPRERRISQLRSIVLHKIRNRRPTPVFEFYCGSHHEAPFGHTDRYGRLRLTYSSSNLRDLELFVHYVLHLATGADPLVINTPVIFGWTDGAQEWPRSEVYRRKKAPFPGAKWMRFTAGSTVEFALEPEVLTRIQTQWDQQFAAATRA